MAGFLGLSVKNGYERKKKKSKSNRIKSDPHRNWPNVPGITDGIPNHGKDLPSIFGPDGHYLLFIRQIPIAHWIMHRALTCQHEFSD